MINNFWKNARKPEGIFGIFFVKMMNIVHSQSAKWAISLLSLKDGSDILDIGCGGGKNIQNLLKLSNKNVVYGVDYSQTSVKNSINKNKKAIKEKRAFITQATASNLPFSDAKFDLITAFETIYFWGDLEKCFKEVKRVLKDDGVFMVHNEVSSKKGNEKWLEKIDLEFYEIDEVENFLKQAGFSQISHIVKNNWICFFAKK